MERIGMIFDETELTLVEEWETVLKGGRVCRIRLFSDASICVRGCMQAEWFKRGNLRTLWNWQCSYRLKEIKSGSSVKHNLGCVARSDLVVSQGRARADSLFDKSLPGAGKGKQRVLNYFTELPMSQFALSIFSVCFEGTVYNYISVLW